MMPPVDSLVLLAAVLRCMIILSYSSSAMTALMVILIEHVNENVPWLSHKV